MRAVFDALDRRGIRYFVTGSVAASVYGVLRQSQDTDVVVELDISQWDDLCADLGPGFVIAEPIDFGMFSMASIIERDTADKVDVILAARDFERSAMERRRPADVPGLGQVWINSVEDLILAKLAWSEGTSELQLRDCAQLLRLQPSSLDLDYLARWAERLGVSELLRQVS